MKARPLILIIVTLLIGFIIGVLVSAQLRHKRMRPVRIYSSERQFKEGLSRMIQPDEEQMELIEPIIKKYGKESTNLQREFRKDFEDIMGRYWDEIKPVLTNEQLERLEQMEKRRHEATRRFRSDSTRNRRDSGDSGRDGFRGSRDFQDGGRDSYRGPGRPGHRDSSDSRPDSLRSRDFSRN